MENYFSNLEIREIIEETGYGSEREKKDLEPLRRSIEELWYDLTEREFVDPVYHLEEIVSVENGYERPDMDKAEYLREIGRKMLGEEDTPGGDSKTVRQYYNQENILFHAVLELFSEYTDAGVENELQKMICREKGVGTRNRGFEVETTPGGGGKFGGRDFSTDAEELEGSPSERFGEELVKLDTQELFKDTCLEEGELLLDLMVELYRERKQKYVKEDPVEGKDGSRDLPSGGAYYRGWDDIERDLEADITPERKKIHRELMELDEPTTADLRKAMEWAKSDINRGKTPEDIHEKYSKTPEREERGRLKDLKKKVKTEMEDGNLRATRQHINFLILEHGVFEEKLEYVA